MKSGWNPRALFTIYSFIHQQFPTLSITLCSYYTFLPQRWLYTRSKKLPTRLIFTVIYHNFIMIRCSLSVYIQRFKCFDFFLLISFSWKKSTYPITTSFNSLYFHVIYLFIFSLLFSLQEVPKHQAVFSTGFHLSSLVNGALFIIIVTILGFLLLDHYGSEHSNNPYNHN